MDVSTGVEIATAVAVADNAWSRFRGLMLRSRLPAGEGLIIRPCGSIHMMFMRFAIDAVFFDAEHRVTKVGRNVRPWIGVAFGGRGAKGVIELPVGGADGVLPGHALRFAEAAAATGSVPAIA
ncbi:MAG: DUF192 domain-containing protein [Tepidiformaceae bacterium]